MHTHDLYSIRQKQSRCEGPEVYQYETIPKELRIQIIRILNDVFQIAHYGDNVGEYYKTRDEAFEWIHEDIHERLSDEYGLFRLDNSSRDAAEAVRNFLLRTPDTDRAVDVIEIAFNHIEHYIDSSVPQSNSHAHTERKISPDDAIDKLNRRFHEHGVGFQYESGQIIRVDSQFIHPEVVRSALNILSDPMYEGANQEFLKAHEHYRNGQTKECLTYCLNAFESCMKIICKKRGWSFAEGDTAKRLITIVFKNRLIPCYMQTHFSSLRNTLESGVPTLRNKLSGHGQGPEEIEVPDSIAAYALHLTASNILLLARRDREIQSEAGTNQGE
ncbi:MAG: hypothetical protein OXF50_15205 [Caldilineaceae bacterium]|nr:hypothetical protein [Caldilineaceae bacterium]